MLSRWHSSWILKNETALVYKWVGTLLGKGLFGYSVPHFVEGPSSPPVWKKICQTRSWQGSGAQCTTRSFSDGSWQLTWSVCVSMLCHPSVRGLKYTSMDERFSSLSLTGHLGGTYGAGRGARCLWEVLPNPESTSRARPSSAQKSTLG